MTTVLVEPGSIAVGKSVPVGAAEEHHLGVLRIEEQAELRVVDGTGVIGWGRLSWSPPTVAIDRVERSAPPAALVLAAGAGDRDRFLDLVEKAVELGVTRIVPLETIHSRSVSTRVRDKHVEKLVHRAQQALKQSQNPWLPAIAGPRSIAEYLQEPLPPQRWLADPGGATPARLTGSEELTIAIGPEGGFTDAERAAFQAAGFAPIALGPYILRFDTAAVAALTLANHLRQRDPA